MTIYKPTIVGGPAGDLLLARWAELIRIGYAIGGIEDLALHGTDEDRIELFAAFLAGAGKPNAPANLPDVAADDEELIYVFVGGTYREAKRAALERRLARTWRWRHVTEPADVARACQGLDATDLVIVELEPVGLDVLAALAPYRRPTVVDVDTGGRT